MTEINKRITGALVGLAIGDALGAPFENLTSDEVKSILPVGEFDYFGDSPDYRPGQGTDDTELAFLVSGSLVEKRKLDMADISSRLVIWGKTQKSLGPSTGAGLRALEAGVHFRESGSTSKASSGCLPRSMPIALVYPLETLVAHTIDCCLPTHRHPLALGACVAQNLIIYTLITGLDWYAALNTLNDLSLWKDHVDLYPIHKALRGEFKEPGAVDVLSEAIYCVSQAIDSEQAVSMAVRMGGDADTRAATAGSLAGARWDGIFPKKWMNGCERYMESLRWAEQLSVLRQEFGHVTVNEEAQNSREDFHED